MNPVIYSYWWRVGPYLIPNKPVNLHNGSYSIGGFAEGYIEIMRSQHALSHADVGGTIGFAQYNVWDASANTTNIGSSGIAAISTTSNSYANGFAIAQELEMWAQRSDVLISGMNTLASQVFFECNFGVATASAFTLEFFANADIIFVLENGLLSARY